MKKSRGQGRKNRPTPKRVKPVKKGLSGLTFDHPTVMHARYELELIGEDPRIIDWYCSVLAKWSELGHSGSSAELTADTLHRLMKGENLAPLTADPLEWEDRSDISGYPLWQNLRNTQIFSTDGGATAIHYSELPKEAEDA
jgi:hypothetical protein